MYTILDIARVLKVFTLPSGEKYFMHHNLITLQIFLTAVQKKNPYKKAFVITSLMDTLNQLSFGHVLSKRIES